MVDQAVCPPISTNYLSATDPPSDAPKSTYGFNKQGKFIGCNSTYPYPFTNKHYHHNNFPRCIEYMRVPVRDDRDLDYQERKRKYEEKPRDDLPAHLMDDDMRTHIQLTQGRLAHTLALKEKQASLRCVPQHIRDMPGHTGPSHVQLTSQMYGQYLDLQTPGLPYPQVPVSHPPMLIKNVIRASNMSDHAPIPTHAFCVPPESLMSEDGTHYQRGIEGAVHTPAPCGQTSVGLTSFLTSHVTAHGGAHGERVAGHTWPQYTHTGLELHRPAGRCVGVLEGAHGGDANFFKEKTVPASDCPHIYHRYQRHSLDPAGDPDTEVNPMDVHRWRKCAPFACYARNRKSPQANPCHQRFSQGEPTLPKVIQDSAVENTSCARGCTHRRPDSNQQAVESQHPTKISKQTFTPGELDQGKETRQPNDGILKNSKKKVIFQTGSSLRLARCHSGGNSTHKTKQQTTKSNHKQIDQQRQLTSILKTTTKTQPLMHDQCQPTYSHSMFKQQQYEQQKDHHQQSYPEYPAVPMKPSCIPPPAPRHHLDLYYSRMGREPPPDIGSRNCNPWRHKRWRLCRLAPLPGNADLLKAELDSISKPHDAV